MNPVLGIGVFPLMEISNAKKRINFRLFPHYTLHVKMYHLIFYLVMCFVVKVIQLITRWILVLICFFLIFSGIVRGHYSCPDFTGQNIQDFCHLNDVQTLSKHFQEGG